MKLALVNPPWSFDRSIYFGCRAPHLPLEYGYTKALLERDGHDVLIADAQLGFVWRTNDEASPFSSDDGGLHQALEHFLPDATVITTAPSYLFWRCAPPELRVPMRTLDAIRRVAGRTIAVGPHASSTPGAALRKLRADVAVLGECEGVLRELAVRSPARWKEVGSVAWLEGDTVHRNGEPASADLKSLPTLRWPAHALRRHRHHHHRFERAPDGPGAELEASRGCPYHCTFCAKENFRDTFRKRPLSVIRDEVDGLIAEGVTYLYFIDEIFVPDRPLLEMLAERDISFGVQMRIDNWTPELLELLGRAGCVSIEAGMESISERGRSLLAKKCKLTTEELTELLIHAKKFVPFVQANLLEATTDDPKQVAAWRERLAAHGVWANEPVPLFPYPGSPEYTRRFGACEDDAWERAHEHYLAQFKSFSDIQESAPAALSELEAPTDASATRCNEREGTC